AQAEQYKHLCRYDVASTVRGVKIDDTLLVVGWYTWQHFIENNGNLTSDEVEIINQYEFDKGRRNIRYWGHRTPCIIIVKNHPYFNALNSMFIEQVENYKLYCSQQQK